MTAGKKTNKAHGHLKMEHKAPLYPLKLHHVQTEINSFLGIKRSFLFILILGSKYSSKFAATAQHHNPS